MATLVFGLDGGNWPLVEPWIKDGSLPNIERLRDEGAWGVSRSVLPPTTCPNWKCYASSRSPGANDVYWWEQVNKKTYDVETPDANSFTAPELWDYIADAGLRAGVMNLPMSYPPREVGEFMIAGGPPTEENGYTYPVELESELEHEFGYRVHPNTTVDGSSGRGVEETLDLIQTRFETARRLFDKYDLDFLHLTIFYVNVLQHHFWNDKPVKRAWKIIDTQIGHFLDKGHTIFLMSDHGCTEIETTFYVNTWLEREGYLTLQTTASDVLLKSGLTKERLGAFVSSLGVKRAVTKLVPRHLLQRVPDSEGFKQKEKFEKVDFAASAAIGSGQGLIYLLDSPETDRYKHTRAEIIDGLSALKTPDGRPIVGDVFRGERVYPNGDPVHRPDIVFEQGNGVHTSGAVGNGKIIDQPKRWRAENIPDGMFLAQGEHVDPVGETDLIQILDIAPTVLYAMGEDVPQDFEGVPLKFTNKKRDEPTYREPLPRRRTRDIDAGESVRERLVDIGYLE